MEDLFITWTKKDGSEAPDADVAGYNAADYFAPGDYEDARLAAAAGSTEEADALLRGSYKGADEYGIGLSWQFV